MSAKSTCGPVVIVRCPDLIMSWTVRTATARAVGLRTATNTPTVRGLTVTSSGEIVDVSGQGADRASVGRLPMGRMAAGDPWEEIVQSLRTAEDGRPARADIELRPGGQLVLTQREQPPRPLSQLPRGRMAA